MPPDEADGPDDSSLGDASASSRPDAGTGSTQRHACPPRTTLLLEGHGALAPGASADLWDAEYCDHATVDNNLCHAPVHSFHATLSKPAVLSGMPCYAMTARASTGHFFRQALRGLFVASCKLLSFGNRSPCFIGLLLFSCCLQLVAGASALPPDHPSGCSTCNEAHPGTSLLQTVVRQVPRPLHVRSPPDNCPRYATGIDVRPLQPSGTTGTCLFSSHATAYVTLLEEAAAKPDSQAFFLASTLLEVLFEHFDGRAAEQSALVQGLALSVSPFENNAAEPPPYTTRLSLETDIPLSPFQIEITRLRDVVPGLRSAHVAQGHDWLDRDITSVFRAKQVNPAWKHQFATMPNWHDQSGLAATHLLVYTDGSADSCPHPFGPSTLHSPAAWAFAVWVVAADIPYFLGACAHTAVEIGTPFHLGEHQDTPLEAELLAIAWALAWILDAASAYSDAIELRYDCTSAGGGVFATARSARMPTPDSGPTLADFAAQLRQTAESRFLISHAHVKGHSGELGNELCDVLSGQARLTHESFHDRCLPVWPAQWRLHAHWAWGWMAHMSRPDLPDLMALPAEARRLQRLHPPTLPPSLGMRQVPVTGAEVVYDCTVMSYNILSMFDPTAPKGRPQRETSVGLLVSGKRDLLKNQLRANKIWLAAFQETRLPSSETMPDNTYLMLGTAATANGHGGCSLWIDLTCPYARIGERAIKLSRHEVTAVSCSPRHLHVLIETPYLCLLVCVMHAPRAKGQDDSAPRAFWQEQTQLLRSRPPRADFLLLTDANSHIGEVRTAAILGAGAEPENLEGALFHDFLLEVGAFLPSTDPNLHTGQHWTWQSPDGSAARHRIDFVGVPDAWRHFDMCSWVWTNLEALQTRLDHLPVCLKFTFVWTFGVTHYTDCNRHVCRPPATLTTDHRIAYRRALTRMTPVWWDVPVDHHCLLWTAQMQCAAQQIQPAKTRRPTQAYLQESTLALVHRRAGLREYMRAEEAEWQRRLLMVTFASLHLHRRRQAFTHDGLSRAASWLKDIDISLAQAWRLFDECTVAIRAAVRRDRIAYLDGLKDRITIQDLRNPKALYASVRKAFPSARASRRRNFQPLPAVQLEDGSLALTKRARQDRWIRHFSAQEGGQVVTAAQYTEAIAAPDITVLPNGPVFSMLDVPTLSDVEQVILQLRPNKAAGPDGLTAEVFRADAARTAAMLFPLSLKNGSWCP